MTLRDQSDVEALDRAVDPDGSLSAIFGQRKLPPHDWLLSVVLRISPQQLTDLVGGRRRSFGFTLPAREGDGVRGSGVFCGRCQVPWGQMTFEEREGCRGGSE